MKNIIVLLTSIFIALFSGLAHADNMKPGLWEFNTQMSGSGLPAMPNISDAQRKQIESMGVKLPQAGNALGFSNKVCITPEQAKKGIPPNMEKDGEKCEQSDIKSSGKTTSWKTVCTGKHKVSGSGTVTYDSPEHFSGEMALTMGDSPQGGMPMNNKFSGTFLSADCQQSK
jgi:hypothetical protein